jgi:ElaB/YqjD/DUF883 family membrane-anchored ribosome-binding protein
MAMPDDGLPGMNNVIHDLTALRSDVSKLSETLAHLVAAQACGASGRVMDAVEGAQQTLAGTADALYQSGREALADTSGRLREAGSDFEGTIERNPLTAVLIAASLGLIFGMMGRRDR